MALLAHVGHDVNGDPISWLPGTRLRVYRRGARMSALPAPGGA